LADTDQGPMVGDYLSTSFVGAPAGDLALTVFPVGMPVAAEKCTLGNVTSCNEPMKAPTSGFAAAGPTRPAETGPILSFRSDRPTASRPLTQR
jgi:hypothetical protein